MLARRRRLSIKLTIVAVVCPSEQTVGFVEGKEEQAGKDWKKTHSKCGRRGSGPALPQSCWHHRSMSSWASTSDDHWKRMGSSPRGHGLCAFNRAWGHSGRSAQWLSCESCVSIEPF